MRVQGDRVTCPPGPACRQWGLQVGKPRQGSGLRHWDRLNGCPPASLPCRTGAVSAPSAQASPCTGGHGTRAQQARAQGRKAPEGMMWDDAGDGTSTGTPGHVGPVPLRPGRRSEDRPGQQLVPRSGNLPLPGDLGRDRGGMAQRARGKQAEFEGPRSRRELGRSRARRCKVVKQPLATAQTSAGHLPRGETCRARGCWGLPGHWQPRRRPDSSGQDRCPSPEPEGGAGPGTGHV